jgi:uncharacterized protein YggT (Ycf19 family)
MGYFITNPVGLIIAALNVLTFVLLVYIFLLAVADERSRLLLLLDRMFAPLLTPLRNRLPRGSIDTASVILAAVLQLIAFALKRRYM